AAERPVRLTRRQAPTPRATPAAAQPAPAPTWQRARERLAPTAPRPPAPPAPPARLAAARLAILPQPRRRTWPAWSSSARRFSPTNGHFGLYSQSGDGLDARGPAHPATRGGAATLRLFFMPERS